MADKRASWKPSKTAVGGGGGATFLLTVWALVVANVDMSNENAVLGSVIVGGLGAGVIAWLTPDDSVSFGRRTKEALMAALTYEAEDHAAGLGDIAVDTGEAPVIEPPT